MKLIAFINLALLFLLPMQGAYAQVDDLSSTHRGVGSVIPGSLGSTIRGPNSVTPGSLGSTVRAGGSKPDPMLNTTMGVPADTISSDDMGSSDPMLSTQEDTPQSALSSTNMKSSDPMLSTTMKTPKSALGTSAGPDIDPRLCNALTKHTPDADVAYQPGVDANGNAVVPADVAGAPQMQIPTRFNIPLTFSLAQVLHLDTSKFPYSDLGVGTEGVLGNLTVDGDRVLFNGKPISDDQQDNLAVLCLKQK